MRSEKLYSGESPATEFKPINRGFSLDNQHNVPQPQFSPSQYSSSDSAATSFPIDTTNLYGNSSTLLQSLLAGGGGEQQQQGSAAGGMNFPYSGHFGGMNSGELMTAASWTTSKVPPFLRNSPPKGAAPSPPHSHLQFSNNTAFWNASDIKDVRPSFFPPSSYNAAAGFAEKSKVIIGEKKWICFFIGYN